MKKEKKVRTYQRRTKSGKTITVRAHTASYEAAEKAKEAAKKKGAGEELSSKVKKGDDVKLPMDEFLKKLKDERAQKLDEESKKVEDEKPKKKSKKTEKKTSDKKTTKKRTVGTGTNGPEPKKKTATKKTAAKADASEPAFTRDEFREWYRGTGSDADKKVAKALRKQLGRSGYRKFEDEAIDNYTSRGHLSMFKRVSGGSSSSAKTKGAGTSTKTSSKEVPKFTLSKSMRENRSNASIQMKEYKKQLMAAIKEGNSKKIRQARKGYMQAMDDSTFGGSKASKASAEKDYQSVVKALSKAGYDEQGYKKRSTKSSKESEVSKVSSKVPKAKSEKKPVKGSLGITKSEFKSWYNDTDGSSASFKKVNRALKKFYGKDWDEVENRATFGGKTQYQDMLREIGSRFSTSPKESKKRSVGTGTNGPEPKKKVSSKSEKKSVKDASTHSVPKGGYLSLDTSGFSQYGTKYYDKLGREFSKNSDGYKFTGKIVKKRSVGTGTNGPEPKSKVK